MEWSLSVVFSGCFTVLQQFMVFRALDSEVKSLCFVLNICFCPRIYFHPWICPISFEGMVKNVSWQEIYHISEEYFLLFTWNLPLPNSTYNLYVQLLWWKIIGSPETFFVVSHHLYYNHGSISGQETTIFQSSRSWTMFSSTWCDSCGCPMPGQDLTQWSLRVPSKSG